MKAPTTESDSPSRKPSGWFWPGLFLVTMSLVATTNHSLWIDEGVTAKFVAHSSLVETWRDVLRYKFSEVQMPLYITYMWAFAKIFGHGELALRLAALPLFLSGTILLVRAVSCRWKNAWLLTLVLGASPFAWYYLNEARPYAMQLGATAMIMAALMRLGESRSLSRKTEARWLAIYLIGVLLLSTISMLGEIWAGAALLAVYAVVPQERWVGWWRTNRPALITTAVLLLAVGFYYLWSLTIGARATAVGTTNLQTTLFIFYEQLGFIGLGPGRLKLREAGVQALTPFAASLLVYGVLTSLVLLAGCRAFLQKEMRRKTFSVLACLAVPAGLILIAGVITHFRVLGRHFAPLAVIMSLILGAGVTHLWRQSGRTGKAVVIGFILITLWSCLSLRFAPRHEKDDYRRAATVAKTALEHGEIVWWSAADMAAEYYSVPIATNRTSSHAVNVVNNDAPGFAEALPKPDLVIVSKPDVYDARGALAAYLKENNYQKATSFTAFTVWKAPEGQTTQQRPGRGSIERPPSN
jgi:hypothetical protein